MSATRASFLRVLALHVGRRRRAMRTVITSRRATRPFPVGCIALTAGVVLHLPMFLMARPRDYRMAGMPMDVGSVSRGRPPQVNKVPYGYWHTVIFLAALGHGRIDPPRVLDGPNDSEGFTAYGEQFLLPRSRPTTIPFSRSSPSSRRCSSRPGRPRRRGNRSARFPTPTYLTNAQLHP